MLIDLVKGALILGLDVALINSKNAAEDIAKCKNNIISDGVGFKNEILELITKLADVDEVACVVPCNEFRDSFIPNASVTSNEELLLWKAN